MSGKERVDEGAGYTHPHSQVILGELQGGSTVNSPAAQAGPGKGLASAAAKRAGAGGRELESVRRQPASSALLASPASNVRDGGLRVTRAICALRGARATRPAWDPAEVPRIEEIYRQMAPQVPKN